ncbi:DNA integrity scanning protein DisA nucleotide-binding domain protein, partial [Clostridiaceae bacterium HSG29]|nr:DNA integrity scanning protein DisA nucleotide-binding domain protein [Clostridiaceae bacterium HSG29]
SECLGMNMLNDIYNQINNISSVYYESNTSKGKIVFTSENFIYDNHPNIEKVLMLKERVLLKNKRLVRKLLEICNNDVSLLSDGKYVYGICRLIGNYNDELEDIFIIEYLDVYSWQLLYSNKKLFKVDYEKVYLPQNKITYSEFKRRANELFKNTSSEKIGKLYSVLIEAVKQKHGTMIIISKNARSETERLKSQAFRVEEKEITPSIVKEITSIDGAVLIDTDCKCYGIGVILDGMASNNGNTARGARYNSAIRYVETIKNKKNFSDCLAIVISEDGYVDLISKYTIDIMGGVFNEAK